MSTNDNTKTGAVSERVVWRRVKMAASRYYKTLMECDPDDEKTLVDLARYEEEWKSATRAYADFIARSGVRHG
jgi:hypothetical protein